MSGTGGVVGGLDTVRVPASEIIHLFRPLRPGQIRGEPWLARALVKLNELDQYDDAELVRRKPPRCSRASSRACPPRTT
jgi:Bacteriophage capsid protein